MTKKKLDWRIICVIAACITIIETVALIKGVNGTMFSIALAALVGLGGWTLPQLKTK